MNLTLEDIEATQRGLGHLHLALYHTHQERDKYGRNYPLMAEGVVEEILKLRAHLDELIGLTDYLNTYGPPPTEDKPAAPSAPLASAPTPAAVPTAG